jgi:hypothetical protein
MACTLTALNSLTGCPDNTGGLQYSYVAKLSDITAVTNTANLITALTMSTTGLWKKLQYDKNDTLYFNQPGQRLNDTGALTYPQESLLQFGGFNAAADLIADGVADCCQLVFLHVLTNGQIAVQGLEIDANATGGFTGTKIRDTKVTPTQSSNTSAEEAFLQFLVRGTSKHVAPFTDLTPAEIEAL